MDVEALIEKLGLVPLPVEGGFYTETYRSEQSVPALGGSDRSLSTAIYYLLTPDTFSALHRLASDEIFHFYSGDTVEMLQLHPDGSHSVIVIGGDVLAGESPQVVVRRGTWQGCRLIDGGEYALMGTTVSPGFDYEDYERGDTEQLIALYPACADMVRKLTRG